MVHNGALSRASACFRLQPLSEKTAVLVDGSYYLFRAYHALPPLRNHAGAPTGAIYGVVNMLRKLLHDYPPDYVAVVFDAPGGSFRNEWYPRYKQSRPPMEEELAAQIEPLHRVIRAMGLPLLCLEQVEADDVIATLAQQAEAAGARVIISSGDKDLAQLVNGRVCLLNTMTDTLLDEAGVEQKYGVAPARIIDYLALIGDPVDDIPGVPSVGPKTAAKWLHAYRDLDGVIAHAGDIKGKVGECLRAHLEQLALARKLVTLRRDVPLPRPLEQLVQGEGEPQVLRRQFQRLEFRRWLEELGPPPDEDAPPAPSAGMDAPVLVQDPQTLAAWLERLRAADCYGLHVAVTDALDVEARIVGLAFALPDGGRAYLPLAHDGLDAARQLPHEPTLAALKPLLENPQACRIAHDLKAALAALHNHGIHPPTVGYDTMLESYVLDSTAVARHEALELPARTYLDHAATPYKQVVGEGAKAIPFAAVALPQALAYATEHAAVCLRLHHALWPKLQQHPPMQRVLEEVELPLVPILAAMERAGVLVDAARLQQQGRECAGQLDELEQRAHEYAGQRFNLASPKQLQLILFDKLGLPAKYKTPKGQPSVSAGVLQELAQLDPLPAMLLEHRSLSKLKSTYIDRLPEQIHPASGRIHTCYHQATAVTGRLSSSHPNLQNIPVRTAAGRRIRQAFIAPPGHLLLTADYSQIELRIMAHLSGDATLLAAFEQGEDVHRRTAAEIFATTPEAVSSAERRAAKAINFGLIYGMSSFGLARQLDIPQGEAERHVQRYFERYPGVRAYMERVRAEAAEHGYVETMFGRRLYLPEISARQPARRQAAERTAINAPMQGTAADVIKRAMIDIARYLDRADLGARMIMQVHDELVFEVPTATADDLGPEIAAIMERDAGLKVPLKVDLGYGSSWEEAH